MDFATILGLLSGTGLILGAMFLQSTSSDISMLKFWSTSSMLIVLGGTLTATSVAFRLKEVWRILLIIKYAFTNDSLTTIAPILSAEK